MLLDCTEKSCQGELFGHVVFGKLMSQYYNSLLPIIINVQLKMCL